MIPRVWPRIVGAYMDGSFTSLTVFFRTNLSLVRETSVHGAYSNNNYFDMCRRLIVMPRKLNFRVCARSGWEDGYSGTDISVTLNV